MKNSRIYLHGLHSSEYEHKFDRKALEILQGTVGFEFLFKKILDLYTDNSIKIQYTGSNIKVTKKNFPEIYEKFSDTCKVLDLDIVPELYIQWSYNINGFATGVSNPIVVLNSGCIDLLDDDEFRFLVGHELGHIKSNHVLYHVMASVLPYIGNIIGQATFAIGGIISSGLQMALLNWQRMSEFTADRAGFLACQDMKSSIRAMIKMAGLPVKYFNAGLEECFLEQAEEFVSYDYDSLNKVAKFMSIINDNHPWTVMRASEFKKWVDSGEYTAILQRYSSNVTSSKKDDSLYCPRCGKPIQLYDKFCGACGAPLH